MTEKMDLAIRTKQFSLRIIRLFSCLPDTQVAQVIGKQLLRSGTSVGAHYREAIHARSNNEFTAKIDVGLQELQETVYWMELLSESNVFPALQLEQLHQETKELIAIFVTISKKIKSKK